MEPNKEEIKNQSLLKHVSEIKIVNSEAETNELLSQGWILVTATSGKEEIGKDTIAPILKFCLGKIYP